MIEDHARKAREEAERVRLACPKCQHVRNTVADSRPDRLGRWIWRRRQCDECAYRFTTKEIIVPSRKSA